MNGSRNSYAVVAGLALAFGVSLGFNARGLKQGDRPLTLPPGWPEIAVQGATAQGFDNFAVATGPVQQDIEAFYFLDFLTGDLRATALNSREAKFGAFYEYNIAQDFPGATKNPKYLMVTGMANIPRGRGRTQIAQSVVYITEATTGQMAAYIMPWNSSMQASGKMQNGTFLKIADVQLRSTFVRDQ
ncbi:MAG: hypothetical protein AAGB00_03475 [Planctomycetota bacterium]